ncbi:hypothetical protein [Burkholderia mallei]|uniref:hypothetical protein n=1 Tax=Burkholderia mallei TaxID=13373 RepID=UPI0015C4EDA9|nr:hypothetical protein [Burkholderia mallei]
MKKRFTEQQIIGFLKEAVGFLQKPDDLLFRKALLHVRLLLRKRTLLDSGWPCL